MKKIKYYFNTHTLRYEKLEEPLRVRLLKAFGFIAASLVTAAIFLFIAYRYFPTATENKLKNENENLRLQLNVLNDKAKQLNAEYNDIKKRDNNIYRAIFEAVPIPDSSREKAMINEEEYKLVEKMGEEDLSKSIAQLLVKLASSYRVQQKSFNDIEKMIKNKEELLKHIPAIQPVANKDLTRVASGFSVRIDPIYKVPKFHAGVDFTAPRGTPIYATANGVITFSGFDNNGYGNHVIINHGFGYETLYAHMVKVKYKAGQSVKRGEVIGWVGNTGKSTGPHCHYEVHKNGDPVDPIYYFYNDLTPAQFDRLLKLAKANNQSFD